MVDFHDIGLESYFAVFEVITDPTDVFPGVWLFRALFLDKVEAYIFDAKLV